MKKLLSLLLCSLVLITSRALTAADDKTVPAKTAAAEVSGKWDLTVETSAGTGNPEFTFKQDGEKLTGTYKGLFGEAAVTGSLKGHAITFSFKAEGQGQGAIIAYSGTVDGATMKGKVQLGELGEGTFTGKKQAK